MVTPISDMLELWLTDNKKSAYIPKPSSDLIPIDTPLMASGYSAGGMEYLSDKMQDFHMIPFSAVSVDQDTVARPLEAGGAVAASLVTGDLKLGAIGTGYLCRWKPNACFWASFHEQGKYRLFHDIILTYLL